LFESAGATLIPVDVLDVNGIRPPALLAASLLFVNSPSSGNPPTIGKDPP